MPLAQITIMEGRSTQRREEMMQRVAQAISESLDAPIGSVRVILHEVPAFHWSVGGEPKGPPDNPS